MKKQKEVFVKGFEGVGRLFLHLDEKIAEKKRRDYLKEMRSERKFPDRNKGEEEKKG